MLAHLQRVSGGRRDDRSFFFFNDTATTGIYTLSLHDALPISGPLRMALPRLPISFRSFSAQRKKTRSLAPKLWSALPTQFQNLSWLKCSAQARFRCQGATAGSTLFGSGKYAAIFRAVELMRSAGMMLPGNGSRVQTPLTSRPVAGS